MRRHGFSIVELVLAMTVALAIVSLSILYYGDYRDQGVRTATLQDLDGIRRAIEVYEAQTKRPFRKATLPDTAGFGLSGPAVDHWGTPYRIDPDHGRIYSCGPDRHDDGGSVDDIVLEYHGLASMPSLRAPIRLSVVPGGPPVRMTWQSPPGSPTPSTYRIERRVGTSTTWEPIATVAAGHGTPLAYSDPAPGGTTAFYRVVACLPPDTESPPSDQAGWASQLSSRPTLSIQPQTTTIASGASIDFDVRAASYGSPLSAIEFDDERTTLQGTMVHQTYRRRFSVSRSFRVTVFDQTGS